MSNLPNDLKYNKSHEWARNNGDGTLTLGITDHAQELLGDLVFVELPEVGQSVAAGGECAVVESVKAASDVYSPAAGELINEDPYGEGWILKLRMSDASEWDNLLDADAYAKMLAEDA